MSSSDLMRRALLEAPTMAPLLAGTLAHLRDDVYGAEFWPAELHEGLERAVALGGDMLVRTALWLAILAREPTVQRVVASTLSGSDQELFASWLPLLRVAVFRWQSRPFGPASARVYCAQLVDEVRGAWFARDRHLMATAAPLADELERFGYLRAQEADEPQADSETLPFGNFEDLDDDDDDDNIGTLFDGGLDDFFA